MNIGGMLSSIGVGLAIYFAATLLVMALGLWLAYTLIWRAVRRGMREFYAGQLDVARQVDVIRRGPRDW